MSPLVSPRRLAQSAHMLLAAALAACSPTQGPLWGPNSPRNRAGEVVDPHTGTSIGGYPPGSSR